MNLGQINDVLRSAEQHYRGDGNGLDPIDVAISLSGVDEAFRKLSGFAEQDPLYLSTIGLYNRLADIPQVSDNLVELGSRVRLIAGETRGASEQNIPWRAAYRGADSGSS